MLNSEFITYEQALKLKELGFDKECFGWYNGNKPQYVIIQNSTNKEWEIEGSKHCAAPLKQQAFKWFRENDKLFGVVNYYTTDQYFIEILDSNGNMACNTKGMEFITYEEAELKCIDKLIELINFKS
jgi:hypothetical protein